MDIRDKAQSLADKIRPLLSQENNFEIDLADGSTVCLHDVQGSGYVMWFILNPDQQSYKTSCLPEVRQVGSIFDRLPTTYELSQFMQSCSSLVD